MSSPSKATCRRTKPTIEKINTVKNIIEALLDSDQKSLTKIANANQQWLKTATARQCPECRSTEVRTDGVDYGICDSCDCSFSF